VPVAARIGGVEPQGRVEPVGPVEEVDGDVAVADGGGLPGAPLRFGQGLERLGGGAGGAVAAGGGDVDRVLGLGVCRGRAGAGEDSGDREEEGRREGGWAMAPGG
jgi:hypothetical protein